LKFGLGLVHPAVEAIPLTERAHVPSYVLAGEGLTECWSGGTWEGNAVAVRKTQ